MKSVILFAALSLVLPLQLARAEMASVPSFRDTASRVKSSVVNISTTKNVKENSPFTGDPFFQRFFGGGDGSDGEGGGEGGGNPDLPTYQEHSLGSGVIIDAARGYILTNNHVVDGADEIKVKLSDGREFDGEIVGRDPKTDLAVLRTKNATGLVAAPFGDSDAIEVGDWVLAIGSPFGLEQTVSHGIISAKGRVIGEGPYDDFLQTDAPINPGNSGGPLVNLNGEVVGINTAITSRSGGSEGVGFAIPSNLAKKIYGNLITDGKVSRGWLGIQIQDLDERLSQGFGLPQGIKGVLVSSVMDTGPAHEAGMKDGDVITEFAGQAIDDVRGLQRQVAEAQIGVPATIKVWRGSGWKTLSIKIGNMASYDETPSPEKEIKAKVRLGIVVRPLTEEELAQGKSESGVVVQEVEPGSAAEQAGLQAGDVITEFDRSAVNSPEQLAELTRLLKRTSVILRVKRGDGSIYVALDLSGKK